MPKLLYKMAFRNLFSNQKKSLIALLAMMVGMISFGTMFFSHQLVTNEIITTYSSINPSSATLNVDIVDEKFIQLTRGFNEIKEYEVKTFYQLRGQDRNGNWKTVELFSSENYEKLNMNKVFYIEGVTRPQKDEMLIEQDAMGVSNKRINDFLTIKLSSGEERQLLISGVVNDISVHPATMHNTIYAYVSPETLDSLGLVQNRIDIKIKGDPYNREQIINVSNEYMKMLESNGYQIKNINIEKVPGVSMHLEEYKTALFLLKAFSIIVFIFTCLIMGSLITSIMSQQIKQIGILKSFGARKVQIMKAYLIALFLPVGISSMISLPISRVIAILISTPLLRLSNISLTHTSIPIELNITFLVLSLILPICIAYPSIARGTGISIHNAINNITIPISNKMFGHALIKHIWKRSTRLSIRNALRNKSRFVMNVFTLTMSGICFITILISMLSVQSTLDSNMDSFKYDYRFLTSMKEKDSVKNVLSSIKDINEYEVWGITTGKYVENGDKQDKSYPIMAIPNDSSFIEPDMISGAWINNSSNNQVVISHQFLNNHTNLRLGDLISFNINKTKVTFIISGIIKDFSGANVYINLRDLEKSIPSDELQGIIQTSIDSNLKGRKYQKLIHSVEQQILTNGISILQSESKTNALSTLKSHYMTTFQTLLSIIFMIAIVSGFGLASTIHIQTLERVKEIGIMKSFGASRKQIIKLITTESSFITLFSWCLSAILSIPTILLAINFFSQNTLKAPIQVSLFNLTISNLIWLFIVLIIGRRASKKPAKKASIMIIKTCLNTD